jgi:hypothetical protein
MVSVGWVTKRLLAAETKCRKLSRATMYSNCCNVIIIDIIYTKINIIDLIDVNESKKFAAEKDTSIIIEFS